MELVPAIGLEVHAQLKTRSKMFCSCPAGFGGPPNTRICPVCWGMPGALPVLNRRAVAMALKLAAATGAEVRRRSLFARKNYFYPDLPKGYQISQYEEPLCEGGHVFVSAGSEGREIPLTRIHLEEDAGKSIHSPEGRVTLVDMNRCGIPLVEIVSEPVMASPAEARRFVETLKTLLEYLDICEGNMEEGNLRCDGNVSVRAPGEPLGERTEIKNLNSIRSLERALRAEIERQRDLISSGKGVVAATLLWDDRRGELAALRDKEGAHDYRYFPEPDLPALVIDPDWLHEARHQLPELPERRIRRFREEYGLPDHDARLLAGSRALADFFEDTARLSGEPGEASKLTTGELMHALKETGEDLGRLPITPAGLAELIRLQSDGVISGKIAKDVFGEMLRTGETPSAVVGRRGLTQITDRVILAHTVKEVLAAHPGPVEEYQRGRQRAWQFLVGQVMKATKGKADPAAVNDLLREALTERGAEEPAGDDDQGERS